MVNVLKTSIAVMNATVKLVGMENIVTKVKTETHPLFIWLFLNESFSIIDLNANTIVTWKIIAT